MLLSWRLDMRIGDICSDGLAFFSALHLPVPENNAYQNGNDCLLAFLADYGMVVRVSENDTTEYIKHRRILQPVLSCAGDDVTFELFPAVKAGVRKMPQQKSLLQRGGLANILSIAVHTFDRDARAFTALHRDLKRDQIEFEDYDDFDGIEANVGYIPVTTGADNASGYMVVIDRGAVWTSDPAIEPMPVHDPQQAFYAPLYAVAKACLPDFSQGLDHALKVADAENVSRFWAYCRKQVDLSRKGQPSLLFPAFDPIGQGDASPRGRDAVIRAACYRAQLTRTP